MKKIRFVFISLLTWGIVACTASYASTPIPPIQITAFGMHYGGQVVYKFQVKNMGTKTINSFLVGDYPSETQGKAELSVHPKRDSAKSFWLSSQVAERPNGWGVRVLYPEESETFSIEFVEGNYFYELWPKATGAVGAPVAAQKNNGIPPNTTWNNFSVNVPTIDLGFVQGHTTFLYGDDLVTIPIVKGDTVAPTIDLIVNRLNQNVGNGTWAIFDIHASAKDNYDPSPTLDFAPITSNQLFAKGDIVISKNKNAWTVKLKNRPNRTYQMKVTSEDASGNISVKTFDYAVSPK